MAIDTVAFGGDGVGRTADGRVIFIPRTLPGETVSVRVTEERKDFLRGELNSLHTAAAGRVPAPCPYYAEGCGGCSWQHAGYELQLSLKRGVVIDQLRRIGRFEHADVLVLPTIGMVEPWYYRNQARFTVGRRFGDLCFTLKSSHRLLRVDQCTISHPRINQVLPVLQGRLAETERHIHQVSVRVGANTGDLLISPALPEVPEIESGQSFLVEELLGRRFRLQPASFFQVNTRRELRPLPSVISRAWRPVPADGLSMAEILALLVMDRVQPKATDLVVDAYGGVGTFALLMADLVGEVIGIEESRSAVRDAVANAANAPNVQFLVGRTEDVLPSLALRRSPDAVILDPARAGAQLRVLEALVQLKPPRLVYVSCDPTTLARDLRILVDGGYRLAEVQPLDMFPQTYHVECIATLYPES